MKRTEEVVSPEEDGECDGGCAYFCCEKAVEGEKRGEGDDAEIEPSDLMDEVLPGNWRARCDEVDGLRCVGRSGILRARGIVVAVLHRDEGFALADAGGCCGLDHGVAAASRRRAG